MDEKGPRAGDCPRSSGKRKHRPLPREPVRKPPKSHEGAITFSDQQRNIAVPHSCRKFEGLCCIGMDLPPPHRNMTTGRYEMVNPTVQSAPICYIRHAPTDRLEPKSRRRPQQLPVGHVTKKNDGRPPLSSTAYRRDAIRQRIISFHLFIQAVLSRA